MKSAVFFILAFAAAASGSADVDQAASPSLGPADAKADATELLAAVAAVASSPSYAQLNLTAWRAASRSGRLSAPLVESVAYALDAAVEARDEAVLTTLFAALDALRASCGVPYNINALGIRPQLPEWVPCLLAPDSREPHAIGVYFFTVEEISPFDRRLYPTRPWSLLQSSPNFSPNEAKALLHLQSLPHFAAHSNCATCWPLLERAGWRSGDEPLVTRAEAAVNCLFANASALRLPGPDGITTLGWVKEHYEKLFSARFLWCRAETQEEDCLYCGYRPRAAYDAQGNRRLHPPAKNMSETERTVWLAALSALDKQRFGVRASALALDADRDADANTLRVVLSGGGAHCNTTSANAWLLPALPPLLDAEELATACRGGTAASPKLETLLLRAVRLGNRNAVELLVDDCGADVMLNERSLVFDCNAASILPNALTFGIQSLTRSTIGFIPSAAAFFGYKSNNIIEHFDGAIKNIALPPLRLFAAASPLHEAAAFCGSSSQIFELLERKAWSLDRTPEGNPRTIRSRGPVKGFAANKTVSELVPVGSACESYLQRPLDGGLSIVGALTRIRTGQWVPKRREVLEQALVTLDKNAGWDDVRRGVLQIANQFFAEISFCLDNKTRNDSAIEACRAAERRGPRGQFYNIVLTGPAGTGKSTAANVISDALFGMGLTESTLLTKFKLSAASMRNGYKDGVANITTSFLLEGQRACAPVFFDEAYDLFIDKDNDGRLVANAILVFANMPKDDSFLCRSVIILAGYKKRIEEDILKSNEGLDRRFPIRIDIAAYQPRELAKVIVNLAAEEGCAYAGFYSPGNVALPDSYEIRALTNNDGILTRLFEKHYHALNFATSNADEAGAVHRTARMLFISHVDTLCRNVPTNMNRYNATFSVQRTDFARLRAACIIPADFVAVALSKRRYDKERSGIIYSPSEQLKLPLNEPRKDGGEDPVCSGQNDDSEGSTNVIDSGALTPVTYVAAAAQPFAPLLQPQTSSGTANGPSAPLSLPDASICAIAQLSVDEHIRSEQEAQLATGLERRIQALEEQLVRAELTIEKHNAAHLAAITTPLLAIAAAFFAVLAAPILMTLATATFGLLNVSIICVVLLLAAIVLVWKIGLIAVLMFIARQFLGLLTWFLTSMGGRAVQLAILYLMCKDAGLFRGLQCFFCGRARGCCNGREAGGAVGPHGLGALLFLLPSCVPQRYNRVGLFAAAAMVAHLAELHARGLLGGLLVAPIHAARAAIQAFFP